MTADHELPYFTVLHFVPVQHGSRHLYFTLLVASLVLYPTLDYLYLHVSVESHLETLPYVMKWSRYLTALPILTPVA